MRPVKKLGKDAITATQLAILSFTGLFSPLIWLLPHTASHIAGSASVFSPLIAILPLGMLAFVIFSLIKNRRSGEGLADIIIRCTGNTAGRIICFLYLLWFIFYAAVSLRSSSERFLSTIFPGGSLWVFMPITLLLAVIGALGKVRSLAGAAQIFFRVIVLALLGIFLFTLPSVSRYNLLPYTYKDIPAAALGGLAVANAISPAIYILFLLTKVEKEKLSKKTPLLLTFLMLLISLLMFITIIGNFGEQFTATMQNPFFTMIRNISIFDVVERVEAVVVAMWVLTDFIFLSVLLLCSKTLVGTLLPKKQKLWPVLLLAAAIFTLAMFLESNAFSFARISQIICPAVNVAFAFLLPITIWIWGKLRKKI